MKSLKLLLFLFILLATNYTIKDLHADEVDGLKPNIVFMLADDMGWNQPGFNGGNKNLTPNIDKLAESSMRLSHYYTLFCLCTNPWCFLNG